MGEVAVRKSDSFWDQIQQMEDRIMKRAEDIFRRNGSPFGKDLENWLAAEKELVWKPAVELKENSDAYELRADVAGIDPKDLQVEVTAEDLLVKGETRREEKREEGKTYISEFQTGSLFRSIHFPRKVNPDRVKAELKNGVLTVTAPFAEATEQQPRRIGVSAG